MTIDIVILAGPVRSGKTTALRAWAAARPGVAGLLQPDGPQGRELLDLTSGKSVALEAPDADEETVDVGRFRFRRAAFGWANAVLRRAADADSMTSILIDEVGPLELRGEGLHEGLQVVLSRPMKQVLLVVRDGLVDAVSARYFLRKVQVTTIEEWRTREDSNL